MKIQFDTTSKTIRIEERVNLGEFIEKMEMLLPNEQWKEFKLEVTVLTNWINPIIIEKPIPFTNPYKPFWYQQPYTTHSFEPNTYNIQF